MHGYIRDGDGNPLPDTIVCATYGNVDFFSRGEDTFRGCVFSDNTGYFNIPAINKKMIAGGSIFDTDSIPAIGYMHPDWGYKRFFNNKEIPASGLNLRFSKPSENRSPITEFCNDYTIEWCNENLN